MSLKTAGFSLFFCLFINEARAGDAIAMGYNWAGVCTTISHNRSSTPKGGAHYHSAAQACASALHDLHARGDQQTVRSKIIGQSDRTGYVAVAQGRKVASANSVNVVTVIGRGKTQADADQNAFQLLADRAVTDEKTIIYKYFSYGSDSAAAPRAVTASSKVKKSPHGG